MNQIFIKTYTEFEQVLFEKVILIHNVIWAMLIKSENAQQWKAYLFVLFTQLLL